MESCALTKWPPQWCLHFRFPGTAPDPHSVGAPVAVGCICRFCVLVINLCTALRNLEGFSQDGRPPLYLSFRFSPFCPGPALVRSQRGFRLGWLWRYRTVLQCSAACSDLPIRSARCLIGACGGMGVVVKMAAPSRTFAFCRPLGLFTCSVRRRKSPVYFVLSTGGLLISGWGRRWPSLSSGAHSSLH